jgi:predicted Zn-dependent protease
VVFLSVVSNIFSAVIISVLVLFAVLVAQMNEADYFASNFKSTEESFFQKKAESDLDAVLSLTEPTTRLSLLELVSNMVYYRQKTFDVGNTSINAEKTVENTFNAVFGKENYYFKAEYKPDTVRLYFLIDGSKSMEDDVSKISMVLPDVEKILKKEGLIVKTKIFIGQKDINCSVFSGYSCEEVDEGTLYSDFQELRFNLGSESGGGSSSLRGDFYEDWATLSLFASKRIPPKTISEGTITLLFPVSDELSSGSEADYCYTSSFYWHGFNSKVECMVCSTDSGYERSKKTIDFAVENMKGLDYIVLPILVSGCKIPKSVWRLTASCGKPSCNGCIVELDETACYHPEVFNDSNNSIKSHMLYFSRQINGSNKGAVIDLSAGYSEEELKKQLQKVLEEFVFFSVEFGTKKDAERISIKRLLPLRGKTFSEITFWSYLKKKHFVLQQPEAATGERPVAVINLTKDLNDSYKVFADASLSFDPNGSALAFAWRIDDGNIISTQESFVKTFDVGEEGMHEFELTAVNSASFEGKAVKEICVGPDSFCEEKKKFFILPVEFSLGDVIFEKYAEQHWKNFYANIVCPSKIQKIILKPSDFSDASKGCKAAELLGCIQNPLQLNAVLKKIDDCIQSAGYNLSYKDRVLGITSANITVKAGVSCSTAPAGYTTGIGTENTVVSEYNVIEASTHELGHTFGLCEEYSLAAWNKQNTPSINAYGSCQNPYPQECMQFNAELCNQDGICQYYGTGGAETSLNCPKPNYDCPSFAGASCGNKQCDVSLGENTGNCQKDCFGVDCYGTKFSNGMHSVMGPASVDGSIDGVNAIRGYESQGKAHINSIVCGGS